MFGDIPFEKFIPHNWRSDVMKIGEVPAAYMEEITDGLWHDSLSVEINRLVMDDKYGRNYTDEQKEIELTRLQQSGIRFARQYFQPEHAWDNAANGGKGGWNLGGNGRIKYFWDYCKGLQSKGINVMLSVGWHLAAYSNIDHGSMASQPYINDLALYPNEFYGGRYLRSSAA